MTAIADFPGLRYIDPFASFCNDPFCLPYSDVGVLFTDDNHLSDAGMDRLIATYQTDFEWLVAAKSSSIAPSFDLPRRPQLRHSPSRGLQRREETPKVMPHAIRRLG